MPTKARWLLNIPTILDQLESMAAPVINRAVCEQIFQVQRRQAINLIGRFGGYFSGNTILIDRISLIERLRKIDSDPDIAIERRRKQKLTDELDKLSRYRTAARVRIPVGPDVHSLTLLNLPETIRLSPGHLSIQFEGVEQLLTHLYELSQAAANDYECFCRAVTDASDVPGVNQSPSS